MAQLKVYEWEKKTWPEFQEVKVNRFHQGVLLMKLSRHFKVDCPELRWSYRSGVARGNGGGSYHRSNLHPFIRCGKVTTLGTLLHEFAHHLDWRAYLGYGHRRSFKRALKRTYTWAKQWLPDARPNPNG